MRKFGRVTGLTPSTARIRLEIEGIPDASCGNLAQAGASGVQARQAGSADCPAGCPGCGASGGKGRIVELDLPLPPGSALSPGDRVSIVFLPMESLISVLLGLFLPAAAAIFLGLLLGGLGFSGARGIAFLSSLVLFGLLAWLYARVRRRFGFLPGVSIRIMN
jgi:hypothetical protein